MESLDSFKSKTKDFNDLETSDNSLNKINNISEKNEIIEESEKNYKLYVPKIKPKRIQLVPSKLRLNKKGFKDLKRNKDNKILILSNNYFISCPNSEEEGSDTDFSFPVINNKNKISNLRQIMKKTKKENLPRIKSKILAKIRNKKYEKDFEIDNEINNNDLDDLLDIKENDYCNNNEEINCFEEEENNLRFERFNSCSILDVLKNKFSLDEIY